MEWSSTLPLWAAFSGTLAFLVMQVCPPAPPTHPTHFQRVSSIHSHSFLSHYCSESDYGVLGSHPSVGLLRCGKCHDIGISQAYWVELPSYTGFVTLVSKLREDTYRAKAERFRDDVAFGDVPQEPFFATPLLLLLCLALTLYTLY